MELGDHEAAEQAYRAAIPLLEETGDILGQANCIRRLGDIALERLPAGSGHARRRQAGSGQGTGGQELGVDLAGAQSNYEQALAMFRQIGNLLGEAHCIRRLGTIALERHDHVAAQTAFVTAMPMYQQAADVLGHGNCHLALGDVAMAQGDHEGARVDYQHALALFRKVGSLHAIGWTHLRLARLDGAAAERQAEVRAVRQVLSAIGRHDLLDRLEAEFPPANDRIGAVPNPGASDA